MVGEKVFSVKNLRVEGDRGLSGVAAIGGTGGTVGFFGTSPVTQPASLSGANVAAVIHQLNVLGIVAA